MPIRSPSQTCQKAVVSFGEMAALLELSRSRLYQLIEAGILEPPIYDIGTRRPMFPLEVQRRNILYRETNTGADGRYVVFYRPRERTTETQARSSSRGNGSAAQREPHADLVAELKGLGIETTGTLVGQAIRTLYPQGATGLDESELLRAVFRYFRRPNSVAEPPENR